MSACMHAGLCWIACVNMCLRECLIHMHVRIDVGMRAAHKEDDVVVAVCDGRDGEHTEGAREQVVQDE